MEELSAISRDATAAIEPHYFLLDIDGGPSIYRERVYCYELYHQMRCRWPADCPYILMGEVDKRAHPILRNLDAEQIPDLLVHTPGAMAGNNTIIEVKPSTAQKGGVRKDLATLDVFVRDVGYRRAIYLVYGAEAEETIARGIARAAVEMPNLRQIELWAHSRVGEPATHCRTIP